MAKNPLKRKSPKKKTSNKHNRYSHVKTGQTVTFKNGACAKRQSNGQFRFVKRTSCKKSKRGGAPGDGRPGKSASNIRNSGLAKAKQEFFDTYTINQDDLWEGTMRGKGLGDEGVIELVNFFPDHRSELRLGNNNIGDEGVMALAKILPESLVELSLGNNEIGDDGAIALADVLKNMKNLTYLSLNNNKIGYKGAEALANNLPAKLQYLLLRDNLIDDTEIPHVEAMIRANHESNGRLLSQLAFN